MNGDNGGGEAVETSLRDDLRSAWEAVSADDGAAGAAPEPAEGGAEAAPEPFVAADGATPEPRADGRDENGRFVAKPKEADAAPEPAPPDAPADPQVPVDPAAQPAPEDKAPTSWRGNAAAKWSALDPEVRAEVQRREREVATLVGRQDEERAFGREFADVIRPHAETIAAFNVSPQFAVGRLLDNDRLMRSTDPNDLPAKVNLAYDMLEAYGLNPAAFANPRPGRSENPEVAALQREIASLRAPAAQPQVQEFAPLPSQTQNDTIHSDIEAFRADPAHPHFDTVAPAIAQLLESGSAPDLPTAYAMAVAATPSLRSTPPAPAAPVAQRLDPASKAAAARRAASSVTRSPGPSGSPAPMTLRDELRDNYRRLASEGR